MPLGKAAKTDPEQWRAALGEKGDAPPRRLTTKQTEIVRRLVEAHGEDVQAMWRDRKLNDMQHTPAVLRGMLVSYLAHPKLQQQGGGARDFRAPIKKPSKRLQ